jgi:protein-S-isoprenylcysteine O-methyltransferase Ste14
MGTHRRNVFVSLLFVVFGGPAIVLVYVPFAITRFHLPLHQPRWQIALASALLVAGLAPLFESIARFIRVGRGTLVPTVPTERLVVSGLYRYVRNPMYVGVLVSLTGEAILFGSDGMFIFLAAAWLLMHLFVCLYEEPALTRRFPADYPVYRNHVPRWLPRGAPWRGLPD